MREHRPASVVFRHRQGSTPRPGDGIRGVIDTSLDRVRAPSEQGRDQPSRRHLAARLRAVRVGERQLVVDPDDETDLRARVLVEWWRDEHLAPMDETRRVVARICPPNLLSGESVVSVTSRAKRFTTIVDKLLREPVKLADMGGCRRRARRGGQ